MACCHRDTGHTAGHGLGVKGQHKDLGKGTGQRPGVHSQNDDAAHNVEGRHDGDDLFGDGGDALHTAQEDESRNGRHHNAHHQPVEAESVGKGIADGVGLDHVAHEAQRQDDQHREDGGQHPAEFALESRPDVVGGTAGDPAVFHRFVVLGQHSLGVDGGHAEESRHPHPEQRAGAAADHGGGTTGDVAGTHLGRNGGGQRLEGAHTILTGLFAVQGEAAERPVEAFPKAAQLHAPQPDGEKDAGAHQQEQEQVVPQKAAGLLHQRGKQFHTIPLDFLYFLQPICPAGRPADNVTTILCFCRKVKCICVEDSFWHAKRPGCPGPSWEPIMRTALSAP